MKVLISMPLFLALANANLSDVNYKWLDSMSSCTLIIVNADNSSESVSPMLKFETLEYLPKIYYEDFCMDCQITQYVAFDNEFIGEKVLYTQYHK